MLSRKYPTIKDTPKSPQNVNKIRDYSSNDEDNDDYDNFQNELEYNKHYFE